MNSEKLEAYFFYNDPSTTIGPLKYQYPIPGWYFDLATINDKDKYLNNVYHFMPMKSAETALLSDGWEILDETIIPENKDTGSCELIRRIYIRDKQ